MDIMFKYLKIGLRWWWLIVLSVILTAGASYYYTQQLPRIYASTTTLLVGSGILSAQINQGELRLSSTVADAYATLAQRQPLAQGVIDRLGLEMAPEQLMGMIEPRVVGQAQLLEISVLDTNPRRAQILADAVANELILQSPSSSQNQSETQRFIEGEMATLRDKIEEAKRQVTELENNILELTSAAEIAEARGKIAELENLRLTYQTNYAQLASSLGETPPNMLTIIEPASLPTMPIAPSVKLNVVVAAAAGFLLAVGAIVLMEFFNDTVTWQGEETIDFGNIPVIGAVPILGRKKNKLIVLEDMISPEADMVRSLRANIFLKMPESELKTLLVTSPGPGDGKSFTASNLAAVAAGAGTKVILIDADMRRPTQHNIFDQPNIRGLAELLQAHESVMAELLDQYLLETPIETLRLLPAGKMPADTAFLLGSENMQTLKSKLLEQADLVIIDSIPVEVASDTKVTANFADGIILVASHGKTSQKQTTRALYDLAQLPNANILGAVVNRVSISGKYQAYYNYYYTAQAAKANKPLLARFGFRNQNGASSDGKNQMLGLTEMADYLGITEATAKKWCQEGRLPAEKVGRKWQIKAADLYDMEWL